MNEGMVETSPNLRASIDKQLNGIEVDLNGIRDRALRINRMLLGPSVKAETESEKKSLPQGWLNQVSDMLTSFTRRIGEIRQIQDELGHLVSTGDEK